VLNKPGKQDKPVEARDEPEAPLGGNLSKKRETSLDKPITAEVPLGGFLSIKRETSLDKPITAEGKLVGAWAFVSNRQTFASARPTAA